MEIPRALGLGGFYIPLAQVGSVQPCLFPWVISEVSSGQWQPATDGLSGSRQSCQPLSCWSNPRTCAASPFDLLKTAGDSQMLLANIICMHN